MDWIKFDDNTAVAAAARDRILTTAALAIAARGAFRIVLAGGHTPELAYRLLAEAETDWSRWWVYYGDERCLPPEYPERNSRMAREALLERVAIPFGQVFPMPAELGAEAGAARYAECLGNALPFDLVLLGLGEDGHTASLFPGQVYRAGLVMPVYDAPKPPPERISLTPKALGDCRRLLFLVTGEGKREAVRRWRAGESLPAARISPRGAAEVLLDRAAWGG